MTPNRSHHTRSRRTIPAVLVLVAALHGCSAFFDAPDVRIADVRVSGIGLSGATADVVLEVDNPNGFDLTAERLRYRLEFEDVEARDDDADVEGAVTEDGPWRLVASGETAERLSVPGDDSATLTLRVPFEYADVGRAAIGLLRQGTLRYRLTGDVLFDAPLRNIRVPFDDVGEIRL